MMPSPASLLAVLFVASFALAARLEPRHATRWPGADRGGGIFEVLLGEGRRLFAMQFFVKADAYLHAGYYPSIFDDRSLEESSHLTQAVSEGVQHGGEPGDADGHDGHDHGPGEACEHDGFMGKPQDWVERFGRRFYPSIHKHLDQEGEVREILPWLKLSAELDPQRPETYVVAAYWLRSHLKQVDQAEQFLRQGWRANPDSYEILLELGRVFYEDRGDVARARNVWELGLTRWEQQQVGREQPDLLAGAQLLAHLSRLEDKAGNTDKALNYMLQWKKFSPHPDWIQQQIDELRNRVKGDKGG